MLKRTHTCGELSEIDTEQTVVLNGWVNKWRDHGGLIFIDLRDRFGVTQIVFDPSVNKEIYLTAKKLRSEFVVAVKGKVEMRPDDSFNPSISTGKIEILAREIEVLNESKTPPFEISDNIDINEELGLTYRYLSLRRQKLQQNLILRSRLYQSVREYLTKNSFVEIETPVLMKSTPEGARDFLVPSRNYKGKFYALPQSPQTYKQLLMVAGFDRYFQIVKCFRDEDLRRDRQPEFTQIDMEMSFVDENDVMTIADGLIRKIFKDIHGIDISTPIKKMSFQQAFETYGNDKPDLRFDMQIRKLNNLFKQTDFQVFKDVLSQNGHIAGLAIPDGSELPRNRIDRLVEEAKNYGANGLAYMKYQKNEFSAGISKFISDVEKKNIREAFPLKENDLLIMVAGKYEMVYSVLGQLRLDLGQELKLSDNSQIRFIWIVDFPLLEFSDEENRYVARHHPFTSPKPDQIDLLSEKPQEVLARAYDLVLNGNEIAGGSIRINTRKMQRKMFEALKISKEEAENKFGFLMKALDFGAPPHGGIAFGLDRLAMILAGGDSIRDVIAFPKTSSGLSLMDQAPSEVDNVQLRELHLKIL
ncbi:MAG: aspartate--tRNA ligase [Calditrichaceae bacterium]|nr:aspartate--tRNA ligase [Calditrichaceae bacterium]RQV95624.1 MAG: aspartate--tRNA ligase [Calditrichota bacterium]